MSDPIRIAHISDTHLGYRALGKLDKETGRNQRTIDVDRAFERIINDVLRQNVDAVIHGGDVFHHTRPTWQAIRHFIRQMRRIEQAGIPMLVIAGNHDTPRLRTGGSVYSVIELALPETTFVTDYHDVNDMDTFKALDLHVHAIPHGALTNTDGVASMVAPNRRNLLVCHGMVPGILAPGVHTEPGEQELGTALLDPDFDYIALGHYHLAMSPAAKAWYSGSIERFGWGDLHATPGYNIVELGQPGDPPRVEHIDIPTRPMVDLKQVYGDGLRARDIADKVLEHLATVNNPDAMARVQLRRVERPVRREAEAMLRREAEEYVWHLTVTTERALLTPDDERPEPVEGIADLRTLFAEFVASRTDSPYSQEFARSFLERGDRALVEAMQTHEAPAPEEDGAA